MPAPAVRLVATDLDGTIVRRDGTISARTVAALDAAIDAGALVVFVTGRPPRWLQPVVEATGRRGLAVCANGALLYDVGGARILESRLLAPTVVLEVGRRLRRTLPGVTFAVETLDGFRRERGYRARFDVGAEVHVGPLEELVADGSDVVKLLVRQEGSAGDAMLAPARAALDGLAGATHSNARDCLLEVMALGVTKAVTLASLAARHQIDADGAVAFGDMPNDIEMLAWAGRGYAMTDGHPDAVAAANGVAPPCDEDGVAQVLEELFAVSAAAARPT